MNEQQDNKGREEWYEGRKVGQQEDNRDSSFMCTPSSLFHSLFTLATLLILIPGSGQDVMVIKREEILSNLTSVYFPSSLRSYHYQSSVIII